MTHDEVEHFARLLEATYTAWNNPPSPALPEGASCLLGAAALLRRLRDERDAALRGENTEGVRQYLKIVRGEARNKALDEAYMAWKDNYADAGLSILALKTQEPTT